MAVTEEGVVTAVAKGGGYAEVGEVAAAKKEVVVAPERISDKAGAIAGKSGGQNWFGHFVERVAGAKMRDKNGAKRHYC